MKVEQKSNGDLTNVARNLNGDNGTDGASNATMLQSACELRSDGGCNVTAMAV
jgi:hypothetical protein